MTTARVLLLPVLMIGAAAAQSQYSGTVITGKLTRTAIVNALDLAHRNVPSVAGRTAAAVRPFGRAKRFTEEMAAWRLRSSPEPAAAPAQLKMAPFAATVTPPSLTVSTAFTGSGFDALSHYDQRMANQGNQFSVEPPSPSIAVGNGYVLEGVNNAIQIFTTSGTPLLPAVITSNQLFGVAPAIDRTTGINGVYPTDMQVFYDASIKRWFVVQRSQDNDIYGSPLSRSHLYMAVSQSADPTGTYSVYTMDTTNASNPGCPCVPDFPQLGADQNGFYISMNEFNPYYSSVIDATILAISKASLAAAAVSPTTVQFLIRNSTGLEYTIHPARTPPGASYYVANGGLEYFVSTVGSGVGDGQMAVWAMTNTSSLNSATPSLTLSNTVIQILGYTSPNPATQQPGPLPLGATITGLTPYLHAGDTRTLSATYAGGRLYVTLATRVFDDLGDPQVGGAYVILSPTYRGAVSALVLRQGYLSVRSNHLLRPAVAVNAKGKGAIAFTLAGPEYYPSAAFLPIELWTTGTTLQIAAPGVAPEDGFTGYPPESGGPFYPGIARWGDYSGAVVSEDGSIWMVAEYIPNGERTEYANWGTFVFRYAP